MKGKPINPDVVLREDWADAYRKAWDLDGRLLNTIRIADQGAPPPAPTPVEQLEQERDEARREVANLKVHLRVQGERHRDAEREYLRKLHALEANEASLRNILRGRENLDATLIGKLIRLCHPDRHDAAFAALANEVTAKLLTMRKAAK